MEEVFVDVDERREEGEEQRSQEDAHETEGLHASENGEEEDDRWEVHVLCHHEGADEVIDRRDDEEPPRKQEEWLPVRRISL